MKSYTIAAFVIALKIWLIALCCNTFAGSFILSRGLSNNFFMYAYFGSIIGGFFSAPIFIILWVMLYRLLKVGRSAAFIFKLIFTTGVVLALIASAIFSNAGGIGKSAVNGWLFFLAPASGAAGIFINYHSIRKACLRRDEADMLLNQFGIATEEN